MRSEKHSLASNKAKERVGDKDLWWQSLGSENC